MNTLGRIFATMLLSVVLSSCAQHTPPELQQQTHITEMQTHFGSNIGTVIDYTTDGVTTVVAIAIDNPLGMKIDVWIDQSYKTPDSVSIRRRRIASSEEVILKRVIRTDVIEQGVKEEIVFYVYDSKGESLFKTQPIINFGVPDSGSHLVNNTSYDDWPEKETK